MNTSEEKPAGMIEIDITKIDIPEDRLRLVDDAQVNQLLHSFLEIGQLTPIEVCPSDANGRHRLIIGAHRVMAGIKAEFPTMKAVIFAGDPDAVRLHEIDENLYRHELNALDQATFLAERRVIFERLHGPITVGRPGQKGNSAKLAELSFFKETSQKFGLPLRTIERALTRRRGINDQDWTQLRTLQKAIKGAELDVFVAQPRDVQLGILALLMDANAGVKTVTAALRAATGERTKVRLSRFDKFLLLWEDMNAEEKKLVRNHVKTKKGGV